MVATSVAEEMVFQQVEMGMIQEKYDPEKHHRRSIRLQGYDYTQPGAYFVTICTQARACLFGAVADGEMQLNNSGQIAQAAWDTLPARFPSIRLDVVVVMPNHVHGIIMVGAQFISALGWVRYGHECSGRDKSRPYVRGNGACI